MFPQYTRGHKYGRIDMLSKKNDSIARQTNKSDDINLKCMRANRMK